MLQTNKVSHYTTHSYLQHDRACAEGEKAWVRGYLYTFPGPAVAKVGGIRVIKLQWHSSTRTHKAEILLPIAVPGLLGTVLHGRSKVCRAPYTSSYEYYCVTCARSQSHECCLSFHKNITLDSLYVIHSNESISVT